MQSLAPWQRSTEGSFQIVRITSLSEECAGGMFSSPLMTDKNAVICKQGGWQKGKKRK